MVDHEEGGVRWPALVKRAIRAATRGTHTQACDSNTLSSECQTPCQTDVSTVFWPAAHPHLPSARLPPPEDEAMPPRDHPIQLLGLE